MWALRRLIVKSAGRLSGKGERQNTGPQVTFVPVSIIFNPIPPGGQLVGSLDSLSSSTLTFWHPWMPYLPAGSPTAACALAFVSGSRSPLVYTATSACVHCPWVVNSNLRCAETLVSMECLLLELSVTCLWRCYPSLACWLSGHLPLGLFTNSRVQPLSPLFRLPPTALQLLLRAGPLISRDPVPA